MDSNELAQRLRELAQTHELRLIAITSSREHAGRDIARNAGFERYLLKPIAAADVATLLDDGPHVVSSSEFLIFGDSHGR
jgi:CheY-like chemotaxis protein